MRNQDARRQQCQSTLLTLLSLLQQLSEMPTPPPVLSTGDPDLGSGEEQPAEEPAAAVDEPISSGTPGGPVAAEECIESLHRGYPQIYRSNQYAEWTVCRNCGQRSSYCSFGGRGSGSGLSDSRPPKAWSTNFQKGGPLRKEVHTTPPAPATDGSVLDFGKYRGQTYREILDHDPGYCHWVVGQTYIAPRCSPALQRFAAFCQAFWAPGAAASAPSAPTDRRPEAAPAPKGSPATLGFASSSAATRAAKGLLSNLDVMALITELQEHLETQEQETKDTEKHPFPDASSETVEGVPMSESGELTEDPFDTGDVAALVAQANEVLEMVLTHPAATDTTRELVSALAQHLNGEAGRP